MSNRKMAKALGKSHNSIYEEIKRGEVVRCRMDLTVKLSTQYYDDYNVFMEKINIITDSTDKENKQSIGRLVSDKVQLFDNLLPV